MRLFHALVVVSVRHCIVFFNLPAPATSVSWLVAWFSDVLHWSGCCFAHAPHWLHFLISFFPPRFPRFFSRLFRLFHDLTFPVPETSWFHDFTFPALSRLSCAFRFVTFAPFPLVLTFWFSRAFNWFNDLTFPAFAINYTMFVGFFSQIMYFVSSSLPEITSKSI